MSAPSPSTAAPGAPSSPSASVVVPVHNKATITRQCLDALLAEPADGVTREIVVVDDGSTDGTPDLLAGYGDRIRTVRHDTATGFAGACNDGAAAGSGEFVVFLNNDTLPQPGWLAAMVREAETHPEAAAVGARLLFPNDTIQHAGVVFGLDRYPNHIYAGFPGDHPAATVSRAYQAVTAACMLVRRPVWDALAGFDLAFRNGWEDVDFCLRLGEAGHGIRYCAEAVVYHLESASRNLRAPQELANRAEYARRWREKVRPDDFGYFHADGLLQVTYPARYPIQVGFSPLLAGITVGDNERLADKLLHERARQTTILLRNNIVLNVRVQEAELRAAAAEARARAAEERAAAVEERAVVPAPTAEPAVPHPILGRVEHPAREPGVIGDRLMPIVGWARSMAGVRGVSTFVDGEPRGEVLYGEPRPDVAPLHPEFGDDEHIGFAGSIPMEGLADGDHALEIRIVGNDGKVARIATTFSVDSEAVASGRVMMRLDRPAVGASIRSRERVFVSGWAISPHGVEKVEAAIDGGPAQDLTYGALRPDVARAFPSIAGSEHAGIAGSFPAGAVPPGEHELIVRAVGRDGQATEQVVTFAVEQDLPGEAPHLSARYPEWLARHEPDAAALADLAARAAALPAPPAFDLVVPVADASVEAAEATVASVRAEGYDRWRLLLPVSGAAPDDVKDWARGLVGADARIGVAIDEAPGSFAELATAALAVSTADWVVVLPPGDRLAPQALAEVAMELAAHPETDILYADEDKLDPESGRRWDPFFKPDWSPELHLSRPYLGPATFYRRAALVRTGDSELGPAGADAFCYDLALRATEATGRIRHLPRVVLSRPAAMTDADLADPAARADEARALAAAIARRGLDATVEPGNHPATWRVRHAIEGSPGVTVVMPTGGKLPFLRPCLDDLLHRTTWPNLKILILDNSPGDDVAALVAELADTHPTIRRVPVVLSPFNFSALINAAIPHLDTPYAVLLNDDVTVVTPDWIEAMLEHAQQPEVGVVGAKLLYPDGAIQHAGVVMGPYRGTGHAFKYFPGDAPGYFGLPDAVRPCLAVTFACAMMKTDLLRTLNGLDAERLPIAFNDVDFCLRAVEAGYRNVYTPHAVLVHHESVTKTVIAHPREIGFLRTRWRRFIDHDPYYNPNLTRAGEDASLRLD